MSGLVWDGLKGPEMDEINALIGSNMGVSPRKEAKPPILEDPDRMRGNVRMYSDEKAFGFLRADDGEEYFIHKSAFPENADIWRGARVSFVIERNIRTGKTSAVKARFIR
jgi:cold shock CspA family protein